MMSRLSKALFFPRLQNPKHHLLRYTRLFQCLTPEQNPSSLLSSLPRTFSTSPTWDLKESASESESDVTDQSKPNKTAKKPLHLFFRETVGLVPKNAEEGGSEDKGNELCQKLRELQRRLRGSKAPREVPASEGQTRKVKREGVAPAARLYGAFSGKDGEDERRVDKAVSSDGSKARSPLKAYEIKKVPRDMEMFLDHLHRKNYFRDANFLKGRNGKVDARCFEDSYSREYLKHVAKEFGKDHQETSKWLSGSDLKTLAMFGCPSVAKGTVLAAKSLRCFFDIPENTVCSKCIIKESCKFVNKGLHDGGSKHLRLPAAMRVIVLYALEWVDPPLEVPEEIKSCVSRLLKDVVKLSETTTSSATRNV